MATGVRPTSSACWPPCSIAGARVAESGEFTRRAAASGKLDLIRAEALLDVIHAGSERSWRLAQANLGGRLGNEVAQSSGTLGATNQSTTLRGVRGLGRGEPQQ